MTLMEPLSNVTRPIIQPSANTLRHNKSVISKAVRKNHIPFFLALLLISSQIYGLPGKTYNELRIYKDLILLAFIIRSLFYYISPKIITFNRDFRIIFRWLCLFVIISFIGVISAQDIRSAIYGYLRYIVTIPLFVGMYITFKKHPETIELAFKTIIIPILISCVISLFSPERAQLLESLSRGEIIVHSYARGLYDTVSGLSWGMGHVTAITCYYSFKSKLNYQKAIWLGIFIMFLYVNSTLTIRGGFIAAIGSSFIVIYLLLIKNSSVLGRLVLILFIIFTFVFAGNKLVSYFFFQSKGKEVQEITLSYDDMNELSTTRWGRYNYAIREIKQHPLTGIGFHQGLEEATYGTADFHNGILNNAVSAGLISTFVLIVFLLLIFRVIQSRIKDYLIHKQSDIIVIPIAIMFSNLINFLIESGSAFTSTYIGILFWVSLSVLCCGHTNVLRLPVKVLSLGRKTPIPTGEHR